MRLISFPFTHNSARAPHKARRVYLGLRLH
jgi:hypothetical protein